MWPILSNKICVTSRDTIFILYNGKIFKRRTKLTKYGQRFQQSKINYQKTTRHLLSLISVDVSITHSSLHHKTSGATQVTLTHLICWSSRGKLTKTGTVRFNTYLAILAHSLGDIFSEAERGLWGVCEGFMRGFSGVYGLVGERILCQTRN